MTTIDMRDRATPFSQDAFGPLRLLILQSTSFCNIDCAYCYLPDRASKSEMPLTVVDATFRRIFESPYLDRSFTTCWHAGEPLTLPCRYYAHAIDAIETGFIPTKVREVPQDYA
jgi:uncharacterized protein